MPFMSLYKAETLTKVLCIGKYLKGCAYTVGEVLIPRYSMYCTVAYYVVEIHCRKITA